MEGLLVSKRVCKNVKCNVKGYIHVREIWNRCDRCVSHIYHMSEATTHLFFMSVIIMSEAKTNGVTT